MQAAWARTRGPRPDRCRDLAQCRPTWARTRGPRPDHCRDLAQCRSAWARTLWGRISGIFCAHGIYRAIPYRSRTLTDDQFTIHWPVDLDPTDLDCPHRLWGRNEQSSSNPAGLNGPHEDARGEQRHRRVSDNPGIPTSTSALGGKPAETHTSAPRAARDASSQAGRWPPNPARRRRRPALHGVPKTHCPYKP